MKNQVITKVIIQGKKGRERKTKTQILTIGAPFPSSEIGPEKFNEMERKAWAQISEELKDFSATASLGFYKFRESEGIIFVDMVPEASQTIMRDKQD